MKRFLEIAISVKTAACYQFTGMLCVYTALDLLFSWGGISTALVVSFLLTALAGGLLQTLAFSSLVIKKMRYTLRMLVFSVPFFAVLCALAAAFHWFPMQYGAAWLAFVGIFLALLALLAAGFEIFFRITGRKYDGLLGQYRAQKKE